MSTMEWVSVQSSSGENGRNALSMESNSFLRENSGSENFSFWFKESARVIHANGGKKRPIQII